MTLDLLRQQAHAGRGLWIGLFVHEPSEERSPDGLRSADLTPVALSGLHLTLAHLGKHKNEQRALKAAEILAEHVAGWSSGPIEAATWAQGRMDQVGGCVSVLLLDGDLLRAFRTGLVRALGAASIGPNGYYGFHPHLTVGKHAPETPITLHRRARERFTFRHASIVCGDARIDYQLRPPR